MDSLHDVAAGKTAGNTKTARKRGLARSAAGKPLPPRDGRTTGRNFHLRCNGTGMRPTIRLMASHASRTASVNDGLNNVEYGMLGEALRACPKLDPFGPRRWLSRAFLAVTGWRSGEVLALHWK